MSRPHIIAFLGTVGSGKSTQMKLLASELKRRKIKVRASFLKTGHIFAYTRSHMSGDLSRRRKDEYPNPIRVLIEEKLHVFEKFLKPAEYILPNFKNIEAIANTISNLADLGFLTWGCRMCLNL